MYDQAYDNNHFNGITICHPWILPFIMLFLKLKVLFNIKYVMEVFVKTISVGYHLPQIPNIITGSTVGGKDTHYIQGICFYQMSSGKEIIY